MIYIAFLAMLIVTIRYLPFINVDAAVRFQYWAKNVQRKLEETIDRLERESEKRNKKK